MLTHEPDHDIDEEALGDGLSPAQLRFLADVRRRVPAATLRWHRRGPRLLLDVRTAARGGRERSVLVARFGADGAVELDRALSGLRRTRRTRR